MKVDTNILACLTVAQDKQANLLAPRYRRRSKLADRSLLAVWKQYKRELREARRRLVETERARDARLARIEAYAQDVAAGRDINYRD